MMNKTIQGFPQSKVGICRCRLSLYGTGFELPNINLNSTLGSDCFQQSLRMSKVYCPKNQGYEIKIEPPKENCINDAGCEKIQKLIKKYYSKGYIKMQIYLPSKLSQAEKQDLQNEFSDLQISINDYEFQEEDLHYFNRIHKFQGQNYELNNQGGSNVVPPLVQMLILKGNLFKQISKQADQFGYSVVFDYNRLLCWIPHPNKQTNEYEIQELQKFFIDKVSTQIPNSKILEVSSDSIRGAGIMYKLLTKFMRQKCIKPEGLYGQFVLLSEEYIDEQIKTECIQNMDFDQWKNKLYFVINDGDNFSTIGENQKILNNFINTYFQKNNFNKELKIENQGIFLLIN